jgi:hypothetical protein
MIFQGKVYFATLRKKLYIHTQLIFDNNNLYFSNLYWNLKKIIIFFH